MPQSSEPPSPEDLERRLKAARDRQALRKYGRRTASDRAGMGAGFRIAVEFLSAVAVGIGIGYGLDSWLGTRPWLMIVFFVIGSAAGVLNVIRVAQSIDAMRKAEREQKAKDHDGAR